MMKFLLMVCAILPTIALGNVNRFNHDLAKQNAFTVLPQILTDTHPQFIPSNIKDIVEIRAEKNGIIDFAYTSGNGKFRGNVYCELSQLLMYSEKYSNPHTVCFRVNVYERDEKAINEFGKQVGIY